MNKSIAVRLPNWVGDSVMALPGLFALQNLGFSVHCFGKAWSTDLFSGCDFQTNSLGNGVWQQAKQLRTSSASHMILLPNSFSSALSARLANKKIAGFATDGRKLLLNLSVKKPENQHEVEYFWQIIKKSVEHWWPEIRFPERIPEKIILPITVENKSRAENLLKSNTINKPFILLCPGAVGSGASGQSKIWPHWRELNKALISENFDLIACPGPNESTLYQQQLPSCKFIENVNLAELAAIMQKAIQVIANDSGQMHIASAANTKVLGIFGVSDPNRTSPWGGEFLGKNHEWPTVAAVIKTLEKTAAASATRF